MRLCAVLAGRLALPCMPGSSAGGLQSTGLRGAELSEYSALNSLAAESSLETARRTGTGPRPQHSVLL